MDQSKIQLEEKLIGLVQARPCLYDMSRSDYRNLTVKESAWNKISELIGDTKMTPQVCQETWSKLRNQFAAYSRKLKQPTGSAAGKSPYFRHSKSMMFCNDKRGGIIITSTCNIESETKETSNINDQVADGDAIDDATENATTPEKEIEPKPHTRVHSKYGISSVVVAPLFTNAS